MENFTMKHLGYIGLVFIAIVIVANIFTAIGEAGNKVEEKIANTSIMEIVTE